MSKSFFILLCGAEQPDLVLMEIVEERRRIRPGRSANASAGMRIGQHIMPIGSEVRDT